MYLLELGLATWRLAHMLVKEDGPFMAFYILRRDTGIEIGLDGKPLSWPDYNPLHCVLCTSVYTAVLTCLAPAWLRRILAASAIAVLIEKGTAEVDG